MVAQIRGMVTIIHKQREHNSKCAMAFHSHHFTVMHYTETANGNADGLSLSSLLQGWGGGLWRILDICC